MKVVPVQINQNKDADIKQKGKTGKYITRKMATVENPSLAVAAASSTWVPNGFQLVIGLLMCDRHRERTL